MKNSQIVSASGHALAARPLFQGCFAALLAGLISVSLPLAISRAQPSSYEAEGEEVLTRGPVHEAFAAVVSYNPEPGIMVRIRPPELIEELPPEERPEGDDVAWIPGYWGWDDERNDYLWISGTWRILPPGREWMAGYWRENDDEYQWISGYWADTTQQETTYLPPPPDTLEVGANIDAPSADYGWSPGSWVWHENRYAWRGGYWVEGRADWVWVPAYYVWTPRGVIFVEGFWDYPVERRGILFAPVYYQSRGYSRRGYSYSPRIVINLSIFLDNLFLRPRYHHYYFGDYYGSRYERDGFYASISFQSSRRGYDPFYSHNRWQHRSDRDWDDRFRASYQYRRENEAARPPRTWSAQLNINANIALGGQVRVQLAAPLTQLARSPDNTVRLQPVDQGDRQRLARRGRDVQETRDQRRTVEAKVAVTTGRNAGAAVEPARVAAPRSPIAAKRPKAEAPGRPQNADRRNAPAETRPPEPERNAPAEQRATAPRRKEAQESQKQTQQDTERRNRDAEAKAQAADRSRQKTNETTDRNKQQAEERRNAAEAQDRDDNKRQAQESQQKAQQDAEKRNRAAAEKSQAAERSQQQAEERRNASAAKAREESQRKTQDSQRKEQQDAEKRNRDAEAKSQAADRSRQQAEERANASARKDRDESQQRVNEAAKDKQQAEERRNAADAKNRDEAQQKSQQDGERRARDAEAKSQAADRSRQQGEERANATAAKAPEESQRKGPEAQGKAQQSATKRANDAAKAESAAKAKPAAKEKTAEEEEEDAKKEKEKSRGR